jgi:hypothetical protein
MRYDDDYDASDARYDAAMDAYEDALRPILDGIIQPIMKAAELEDDDQPRPWTYHRALMGVWLDDGEDALREMLEEQYRAEAEEQLQNSDPGPCCSDFHCPCGNTNSYRG